VAVKRRSTESETKVLGLLGIGLDGSDGHQRITRAEDVLLVGGSEETHEQMQETVIRVGEALERKGKRLRDASGPELADLIRDARK
jgi:hypothetical protein